MYPLFPLPETVVFPGMTLPLFIFEERYKQMVKDCVEHNQRRLAIVLAKPRAEINDGGPSTYDVATFVDILSVSENPDGTFNILVHGQGRCFVDDIDSQSHPYYCIAGREFALERGDPNFERVAAWDATDTFRDYARTFFAFEAVKQIEEAMPEDLIYQASFICANVRVPTDSRQVMLEVPSLVARFQMAQKLMREMLEAHKPPSNIN